jgi:hopanoid C-3 methylase HpnR
MRNAGHEVKLIDLQVDSQNVFFNLVNSWMPDVIAFSCNYLANIPEIINLAKTAKSTLPNSYIFVGGHSASFSAEELLEHSNGAIDCVLRGEGEAVVGALLEAIEHDRNALNKVPGAVSLHGYGPSPSFVHSLDDIQPARDLTHHRKKYFIAFFDPCASIEFSRGCPWDCTFCSAWTFYSRSYRQVSPEKIIDELERIQEPNVFIVDDVAFIQADQGFEIGELIAKKGIQKQYYLETRGDVLLRNKEVFKFWKDIGLSYMFLGIEALDSEGLNKYRKRSTVDKNFEAIEYARSLGIMVSLNIIADPNWERKHFETIRQFALDGHEIVYMSVYTPYPGTEDWFTESRELTTRDYRLFDIQHSVLPTKLPLPEFYKELVKTQEIIRSRNLSWRKSFQATVLVANLLLNRQTNFVKMLWSLPRVYNHENLLEDHEMPVKYKMHLPPPHIKKVDPKSLYIHTEFGRKSRAIDDSVEKFVNETRAGVNKD